VLAIQREVIVPHVQVFARTCRRSGIILFLLMLVHAGPNVMSHQQPVLVQTATRACTATLVHATVARAAAAAWLEEPHAQMARIVPAIGDGRPTGFKIYGIRPGSALASIGFENGDTVRSVQDREITSPDKALEVYQQLRAADVISVDLLRHGCPIRLVIHVVGEKIPGGRAYDPPCCPP
jgi:general secretion pathway protein C